jgi:P27 family predicted phage terminase small subunit
MASRKPADRRQRRNTPDIGLVPIPRSSGSAPKADTDWLAQTKERWVSFWGSSIAGVTERDTDLPALTRLFGYYDELERSTRALRQQRFVEGSQGQPRLNPAAKYIGELEGSIRQLEDRFGLTPKARLGLGVDFANAHRSLQELNASFREDAEGEDEIDPRLELIEGEGAAS